MRRPPFRNLARWDHERPDALAARALTWRQRHHAVRPLAIRLCGSASVGPVLVCREDSAEIEAVLWADRWVLSVSAESKPARLRKLTERLGGIDGDPGGGGLRCSSRAQGAPAPQGCCGVTWGPCRPTATTAVPPWTSGPMSSCWWHLRPYKVPRPPTGKTLRRELVARYGS